MSSTDSEFPILPSASGRCWQWRSAPLPLGAAARMGVDDLAASLFLSRGCAPADLPRLMKPSLRDWMPDPSLFLGMDAAAERIADAIAAGAQITLFADYDVDGATSAAILMRTLRQLGAAPDHYIPDRLLEGYGPSADALVALKARGTDLVLILDCGTQAHDALAAAGAAGLDVIVVDHHKASTQLPEALALINPNRLDEGREAAAFGSLCTAGLAFLLAAALVREMRRRGAFHQSAEPNLSELLDIVALGTVADVMPLTGLNRAFVALGLRRMAQMNNPGLRALAQVGQLDRAPTAIDLGFLFGPRINAGGRVGQADLGLRLLTTEDATEAGRLAAELDRLNKERRLIEAEVQAAASAAAARTANAAVSVVAGAGWHPGVVGIVAARLKEKLGRPAIVIALGDDGIGKGSGRSIEGVDLGAAIMAARDQGLLIAGGGHAMAAGVTVAADRVDEFADWLNDRLAATVATASAVRPLAIDVGVAPGGMTTALHAALDVAEPCGQGWPRPRVAVGPLRIVEARRIGKEPPGDHVRLVGNGDDGGRVEGVAFRAADTPLGRMLLSTAGQPLWLAGRLTLNQWQGRTKAELQLDDAAPAR